jgi:UBX domain
VTLRIVQGSVEAGYLGAFMQIQEVPTIVCIGNRNTGGKIGVFSSASNSSHPDEMSTWLLGVLGEGDQGPPPSTDSADLLSHSREDIDTMDTEDVSDYIAPSTADEEDILVSEAEERIETSVSGSAQPSSPHEDEPSTIQNNLTPPSSEPEEPVTAKPKKGKKRAKNTSPDTSSTNNSHPLSNHTEVQSWAAKQRQRNIDARKDRDRVLAQIEADKQARRDREAARKQDSATTAKQTPSSSIPRKPKPQSASKTANIQVRLLNGSTIRKAFAPSTLAAELRPWIDKALKADGSEGGRRKSVPAYKLKHIPGPPEPARPIDVVDEQRSLQDLELLPSATLVLVPVKGSVDAYGGDGESSGWGLIDLPVAAVGIVAGAVSGAFGWVTGRGSEQSGETHGIESQGETRGQSVEQNTGQNGGSGTGRIRTMAEMRAEGDRDATQLYNGNQVRDFFGHTLQYANLIQLNFQSGNDDDK